MTGVGDAAANPPDARRQAIVESLFDGLPESHEERVVVLQSIRKTFYAALAKYFEKTLNMHVQSQPQATADERHALASWINQTVRQLGLSLVCPRTHQPAILVSDVGSGSRQVPRFRFQTTSVSGKKIRSCTTTELPELELMQAPSRIESFAKSFQGTGKSSHSR